MLTSVDLSITLHRTELFLPYIHIIITKQTSIRNKLFKFKLD